MSAVYTANQFCDRFADARRGEHLTYFIGALAAGCEIDSPLRDELRNLRDAAWRLYEDGKVLLFQRPLGSAPPGRKLRQFEYIAVKR